MNKELQKVSDTLESTFKAAGEEMDKLRAKNKSLREAFSDFIELHCCECDEGAECENDCDYIVKTKQALKKEK